MSTRGKLLLTLRRRRAEIEAEILRRIEDDDAASEAAPPEYREGLRAAVPIAIDYCLAGIESGECNPPPVPAALRAQARVAARNGVPLEAVLRRYFAGYTLLGDILLGEVEASSPRKSEELKTLLRILAASFDRLLAAIGEEHASETESLPAAPEQRRAELIERLLSGEPLAGAELEYDLFANHLGLIAKGPEAQGLLRELASSLDRRLLLVLRGDQVWAWLGGRKPIEPARLKRHLRSNWPTEVRLAIGGPGVDLAGWRLTHRQARAALSVTLRGGEAVTFYNEVMLLASIMRNELLATSLRQLYLEPLKEESDGGLTARETLRAYINADRNSASTAAALGITRQTVNNRLRAIEDRLRRPLSAPELEAALRLEELEAEPNPSPNLQRTFHSENS
jgi:GGDEF-like domain/PucR C-terminal helix-turn-helix domain